MSLNKNINIYIFNYGFIYIHKYVLLLSGFKGGGTIMNSNTPFKKRENPLARMNKMVVQNNNDREKYTATMEKELRKRLKVAAAMKGMQVSTFIEEACVEKLEREGY